MTTEQTLSSQEATPHVNGKTKLPQAIDDLPGEVLVSSDVLDRVRTHEGSQRDIIVDIEKERVAIRRRLAELDAAHARLTDGPGTKRPVSSPKSSTRARAASAAKRASVAARPGPRGPRTQALPAKVLEHLKAGLEKPGEIAGALGVDVKKVSQTLHALKSSKRAKSTGKRPDMRWSAV